MINPVQLLIKTAANYVAFKSVKGSIDYCLHRPESINQSSKAVECVVCMNVWSNSPTVCPHCNCNVLKKLYRDYDYKRNDEEDGFAIDTSLTMKR